MSRMVELKGTAASRGIARGPLVAIAQGSDRRPRASGDPPAERHELQKAVKRAAADLSGLAGALDEDAAAVLEFQIAMLQDEELTEPVFEAVAAGEPAPAAWRKRMDAMMAEYAGSKDEYFRAREADIRDIRDRVLRGLNGSNGQVAAAGAILVGDDITPSHFLETDWSAGGGIGLARGSASSHVAMLARSRAVPMVVGLGDIGSALALGHSLAILDGGAGTVLLSPDEAHKRQYSLRLKAEAQVSRREAESLLAPARTADGIAISVHVNIADIAELGPLDTAACDGIGLVRTEFLFGAGPGLPDEEAQYGVYRRYLEWAAGKPVTIRTLDAGGDKPIAGLTAEGEANSFLGLRGLRLSLARPEVFRVQLRALARAAAHGPLKVMFPMVTHPFEMDQAVAAFDEALRSLETAGVPCARPALGMMVEVPAAAIAPEGFRADFLSIGSNDLVQYVTATARDGTATGHLYDPAAPAVVRLIEGLARHGAEQEIEVSICGDMAGDPHYTRLLLGAGLRTLSVAPADLGRVKAAIAGLTLGCA
jgi:phosphoenolpyruvate-protein phosphotransferase (PTS system enzyme I)